MTNNNIDISLLSESDLREAAMTGVTGAHLGLEVATLPTAAKIAEMTGNTLDWADQFRAVVLHCYDSVKDFEKLSLEGVLQRLQEMVSPATTPAPAGV